MIRLSLKNYKTIKMESKYERTPTQAKIIESMGKVYENLIAFKKKMNSELVILDKDGKIIRVKP